MAFLRFNVVFMFLSFSILAALVFNSIVVHTSQISCRFLICRLQKCLSCFSFSIMFSYWFMFFFFSSCHFANYFVIATVNMQVMSLRIFLLSFTFESSQVYVVSWVIVVFENSCCLTASCRFLLKCICNLFLYM